MIFLILMGYKVERKAASLSSTLQHLVLEVRRPSVIGDFAGLRDIMDSRHKLPGFSLSGNSARAVPWQFPTLSAQGSSSPDGAEMSEDLQDEELQQGSGSDRKEGGFFSNLIDGIKQVVNDSGIIPEGASQGAERAAGRFAGGSADELGEAAGNAAREGADDLGRAAGNAAREGADDLGRAAGNAAREGADDLGRAAGQSFGQTAGSALGKAVPVIGPAVSVGIDKATTGEVTDKDLVSIGGGTAGGMLGGALAGAAIGSVVPGIGTAAGFAVGLGASLIGGYLGGKAAETAYDATGAKEQKLF